MSKKLPIVAIVGRTNVGKSSLLNAILRRREAIVANEAGTTRDSTLAKAVFQGHYFWLVDTAGIKDPEDDFETTIQEQIIQAVDSADVILVMTEANVMITEEDRRVARMALKSHKPVFLVANKIDQARKENVFIKFERLGIKPIIATSAINHDGINELLEQLIKVIPKVTDKIDNDQLRVAIIGRPNVGKSALFNALAEKQQAIVTERAGTTRDINRTTVRVSGSNIELMDTAGIRRSGKIEPGVERFSVIRALAAIEQADVCLLLMEVNELNVQLDQKIAGMVKDAGKGLILIVSKWDIAEGRTAFTRDELAPKIAAAFDFVPWAPLIFTSAVTGQNVTKLFDLVLEIDKERKKRFKTNELNQWLQRAIDVHPPAGLKNRNPKLNYIVQEDDNPIPAFKIFGSQTKFVHWSYRRYLERSLREAFGFEGTALELWFIEKHVAHRHGRSPVYADVKHQKKVTH
ncbi:MAG: ribosome biogenesis GTPase Der [Candidatus Saccharimonadales bacterium]